jgi:hypothetical protein
MSDELNKILKNIDPKVANNHIVVIEDESEIYAKVPPSYEDLPELPDITGLTRLEEKDVEEFFMDILNDEIRIKSFEGIDSDPWFPGCSCDYCHTFSESVLFKRCTVCNLDMCNKCFGEEIEVKNETKKWAERKDALEECRKHELLTIVFPPNNVHCDVCEKEILSEARYSNREDNIDMCVECLDTEKGNELHELKLCKGGKTIQEQIGYGSVFNWVPLYKDEENNMLLYNAVTGSDNYGKFSFMSCDDHGRCGFSIIRDTSDINDLGEELSNAYHQWREKYEGVQNCDKVYNIPIKQAMHDRNMRTNFV